MWQPLQPLSAHLRELAAHATAYVEITLPVSQHHLFKANVASPNRLAGYGYTNRVTLTLCHLRLHDDVLHALDIVLIQVHSNFCKAQVQQLRSNGLHIKAKKLAVPLCHNWPLQSWSIINLVSLSILAFAPIDVSLPARKDILNLRVLFFVHF